jgi:hypothetical protein
MEHAVIGGPVPLGREQAGPVRPRDATADQEDVGFLAGLQDPELGVDRGELGDQPAGVGFRAALGRYGLVPGGPAITLWQAVGGVELLERRQHPAAPDALGRGRLVVVVAPLTAAGGELSVVGGVIVGHVWCSSAERRIGQAATRPRRAYTSGVSLPLSRPAPDLTHRTLPYGPASRNRISAGHRTQSLVRPKGHNDPPVQASPWRLTAPKCPRRPRPGRTRCR